MATLRLFSAIELDDALRAALRRAQTALQNETRNGVGNCIRWVAPQSVHLTLKFLGNADSSALPALHQTLARLAAQHAPFTLTARGLGCFPNARRPNNVWVGLAGDVARAALLARDLDDACAALGFARDERGFTPHLTLGRVRREAGDAERAALGALVARHPSETYGEIHARAIALIASDLRPTGPVYTILSQHLLREATPR